jgi:anti-anti-sigma factor
MELHYSETDHGIRMMRLTGKLDMIGVGEIETQFAGQCSGDNVRVIVDLAGVDFLTSMGLRLFLLTGKSVASRGGRLVLLNPTDLVREELTLTGVDATLPVYMDLEKALRALR